MKNTLLIVFVMLFGFGLYAETGTTAVAAVVPAAETAAAPAGAGKGETTAVKDGYALLNSLLTLFENLMPEKKAETGEQKSQLSGFALVDSRLSQLSVDAKAAFDAGHIDRIFYHRYVRLLTKYKLIITPVVRGGLLKEVLQRAFDDFVWNVTFVHWRWEDEDGIAKMAAATEEEFVQLMIYLDTRQQREELKKKYGYRMLPPPPAKKKTEEKKPE